MSDTKTAPASDIQSLSFEDALRELEHIVRRLESGEAALEETLAIYERGAQLRAHCETRLKDAQLRVEKIVLKSDGTMATAPLDAAG